MKNSMLKFLLLTAALLAVGCNEKISPQLKEGASSDPEAIIPPEQYYIKVTNTSPLMLNYKLHRTGAGNGGTDCKITQSSVPFANSLYSGESSNPDHDSKMFDVTCYFDMEELSLYHSGFSFDFEASPNTCDFVGYSPFSFYESLPGDSSATYDYLNCSSETTDNSIAQPLVTAGTYDIDNSGNPVAPTEIGCGQMVDVTLSGAPAQPRRVRPHPTDETDLCEYNYPNKSCDTGVIWINEHNVHHTPPTAANPLPITKITYSRRSITCGGKVANCIDGPIREISTAHTRYTQISSTVKNQAYKASYTYKGTIPTSAGEAGDRTSRRYVNFRRNLANVDIDFEDSDHTVSDPTDPADAYDTYASHFSGEEAFQPKVMDLYANNLMQDGVTPIIDTAAWNAKKISNGWNSKPWAAEPYLGMSSYKTNPFYTFYCFDTAFDIKARIRMVVRDWDRVYPNTTNALTLLSDIGSGINARQDYPYGEADEFPGDMDQYNPFNDRPDWDDEIVMLRTPGTFDPSVTIWSPKAGWFATDNFPFGKL